MSGANLCTMNFICYDKSMKRKLFICLLVLLSSTCAFATEATDFLVDLYAKEYNMNVKIRSKKEFCNSCSQQIGDNYISEIIYGQADFKVKKVRKQKVSYICIIDNAGKPFWGFVIPR